ncbi:major tail protein [Streptomyces phage Vondra]|uniref:Major tail protein n=1 Tax=Streptomyces phage Vondra TaxID=2736273 RepID=A0A6M9Z5L4_9CAUD|nr:major tail protein [Streptomyces phage Vondra]QKN87599.1 major tail protein [Streptomyces phage Vondra]
MSTPVDPAVTALARRWRVEVNTGTAETPSWNLCPGITALTPAAEPNIEDSSDYDSDGWAGNTKTGQSWELSMTINRKINDTAKTYNAVHEELRLASLAYGSASLVHVRYYDRNGLPEAYEGHAIVTWAPSGGEYTALDQVEVTLTGDGPLLPIANPKAEEAPGGGS